MVVWAFILFEYFELTDPIKPGKRGTSDSW